MGEDLIASGRQLNDTDGGGDIGDDSCLLWIEEGRIWTGKTRGVSTVVVAGEGRGKRAAIGRD